MPQIRRRLRLSSIYHRVSLLTATCFLLATSLHPVGLVYAQNAPRVVQGQVLSSSGGVDGVTITLTKAGNVVSWTTATNAEGKYNFGPQPVGAADITVSASKPDHTFNPASHSVANVPADQYLNFAAAQKNNPSPVIKIVHARAEPIDPKTSSYRFGKIMDKQYHAANVVIFNKLADLRNGTLLGDSIIVSSASLRVPVNYEVRYIGKGSVHADRKAWHARDLETLSSPNLTAALNWTNWEKYIADRRGEIQQNGGDSRCLQKPDYETPYPFDQMVGTVDRRESREWRSIGLVAAESASTLTSFVTSFVVPVNTNDVPTILDKFKNLLIPSFKEFFPSLKDEHRKNLAADLMKPLEAVAFKDHLQKTVFLPKTGWRDGEWEYRISRVCKDPIEIEAVVAKPGDQLPIHTLIGVVTDESTNTGVPNVKVSLSGASFVPYEAVTNTTGQYAFTGLPAGTYTVTVSELLNCKRSQSESIAVPGAAGAATSTKDFKLPPVYNLTGKVTLADTTTAVAQAKVELRGQTGNLLATTETDANGAYEFPCQEKVPYQIAVTKAGSTFATQTITVAQLGSPLPQIIAAP